ncbi:MAG: hypothetical protein F4Z18_15120 [Caldilineaceae bacterium SB0666_bin_21]|nr:hypothetical protein [Caldilineaceae bacterium SB0666_bin_21]
MHPDTEVKAITMDVAIRCKGEQSLWSTIQDPFSKPTSKMLHRQGPDFVKEEDWAWQGWEVETAGDALG